MVDPTWRSMRLGILAIAFVSTVSVWARVAAMPKPDKNAQKPENLLQASVPLPEWQFKDSESLPAKDEIKAARRYHYQQENKTLQIDHFYVQSDGNVSRYLFVYTPIRTANATMKIKFNPNVGHYGLIVHDGKAYLSACINPRGATTVTEAQFTQNRYASDLQVSRLVPWLLGQESLIDYRCLWTLLSVPLKDGSTPEAPEGIVSDEKAVQTLETAWVSWHQWWQANFPPSQ